jgi:hypothetical protein
MTITPEGWYPDGQGGERWWDGLAWTEHTRPLAATEVPASRADGDASRVQAAPFGTSGVFDPSARASAGQSVIAPTTGGATTFPVPVVAIGVGALLLAVGAFLPWVTIFFLSISGVDARYGLATLAAGLVAGLLAFQLTTGRLANVSVQPAAVAGVVLGVLSLGIALYVGFAIRSGVAEAKTGTADIATFETSSEGTGNAELDASLDDLSRSVQDAFRPGTGAGVYVTALGGVLVAAGSGFMAASDRRRVASPVRR